MTQQRRCRGPIPLWPLFLARSSRPARALFSAHNVRGDSTGRALLKSKYPSVLKRAENRKRDAQWHSFFRKASGTNDPSSSTSSTSTSTQSTPPLPSLQKTETTAMPPIIITQSPLSWPTIDQMPRAALISALLFTLADFLTRSSLVAPRVARFFSKARAENAANEKKKDGKQVHRRQREQSLAAVVEDAGIKLVGMLHVLLCLPLCFVVLCEKRNGSGIGSGIGNSISSFNDSDDPRLLLYSSTQTSRLLVSLSSGYFLWDLASILVRTAVAATSRGKAEGRSVGGGFLAHGKFFFLFFKTLSLFSLSSKKAHSFSSSPSSLSPSLPSSPLLLRRRLLLPLRPRSPHGQTVPLRGHFLALGALHSFRLPPLGALCRRAQRDGKQELHLLWPRHGLELLRGADSVRDAVRGRVLGRLPGRDQGAAAAEQRSFVVELFDELFGFFFFDDFDEFRL